jgi:hypothetical protein
MGRASSLKKTSPKSLSKSRTTTIRPQTSPQDGERSKSAPQSTTTNAQRSIELSPTMPMKFIYVNDTTSYLQQCRTKNSTSGTSQTQKDETLPIFWLHNFWRPNENQPFAGKSVQEHTPRNWSTGVRYWTNENEESLLETYLAGLW